MTYRETCELYRALYGTTIKTCWVTDVRRQMGLQVREACNRIGLEIQNPCPPELVQRIVQIITN
jgi:hypothetical protein